MNFVGKESAAEQETEVHGGAQSSSVTGHQLEVKADDGVRDSEDKDKGKDGEKEKSKDKDLDRKPEREKEKVRALDGASLDNLLQRLPGCVSRDLIDQLTVLVILYYLRSFH
jgi:regulator of nonsense transcripts 2